MMQSTEIMSKAATMTSNQKFPIKDYISHFIAEIRARRERQNRTEMWEKSEYVHDFLPNADYWLM